MLNHKIIKKGWYIIFPALLLSLINMLFQYFVYPDVELDINNWQIPKPNRYLVYLHSVLNILVLFSWEPLLRKSKKELYTILIVTPFVCLSSLFRDVSSFMDVLFLLANSYSILVIVRAIFHKKNYLTSYFFGMMLLLFHTQAISTVFNIAETIFSTSIYKDDSIFSMVQLFSFISKLIFLGAFYYFIKFNDNYSLKDLFRWYKNPVDFKELSRQNFIWNFSIAYTVLFVSLYFYNTALNYSSQSVFQDIYRLLLYVIPIIISGSYSIALSIRWLYQIKRPITWSYVLLFVPVFNILTLIYLTNKRIQARYNDKIKSYKYTYQFNESGKANNFKKAIIYIQLAVTLIVIIYYLYYFIEYSNIKFFYFLLLTLLNFAFFMVYVSNKKGIYLLAAGLLIFAVTRIFIQDIAPMEALSNSIVHILKFIFLGGALFPIKLGVEEIIKKDKPIEETPAQY